MSAIRTDSPIQISEQELHSTLQDFLEENEKKPKESIWNIHTLAGLGFVLTSFAYVGHAIGTEILGLSSLPFIYTLMSFMPYLSGALLGVTILGMFRSSGEKKRQKQREEKVQAKAAYDKLDEFLYTDKERKSSRRKTTTSGSDSFRVNLTQKLFKSRTDRYISGVCGGLAKYLGISSTVIRLIFLAALLLGYGSPVLIYIAMAIVMPKEPIDLMDDFK
jgi:phage shock protein C